MLLFLSRQPRELGLERVIVDRNVSLRSALEKPLLDENVGVIQGHSLGRACAVANSLEQLC